MATTLFNVAGPVKHRESKWNLAGLFNALLRTRREIKRIELLAERERLQLGYQRIPQRVWDRRSALFIDR
jgi:hypothetical protein